MFILASSSPRRLALLQQIGREPDKCVPAECDESVLKNELPRTLAVRLAEWKARCVAAQYPDATILGADTVVAAGRRILPKAGSASEVAQCLHILSGRRHRVYTGVCIITPNGYQLACEMTKVRMKRLLPKEIASYAACGEGIGKAGGYAIQGRAAAFIPWIGGSFDNVVGLPLHTVEKLLAHS